MGADEGHGGGTHMLPTRIPPEDAVAAWLLACEAMMDAKAAVSDDPEFADRMRRLAGMAASTRSRKAKGRAWWTEASEVAAWMSSWSDDPWFWGAPLEGLLDACEALGRKVDREGQGDADR